MFSKCIIKQTTFNFTDDTDKNWSLKANMA